MAPFEKMHPVEQIPPAGSDPVFERQAQEQIYKLDSIYSTGSPVADFELFDAVDGHGNLRGWYRTPQAAIRYLVYAREGMRIFYAQEDPAVYPWQTRIQASAIAALDRILTHHKVTAETEAEFLAMYTPEPLGNGVWAPFDSVEDMAKNYIECMEALKPTDKLVNDVRAYDRIAHGGEHLIRLFVHPEEAAQLLLEFRKTDVQVGYFGLNAALVSQMRQKTLETLDRILRHHQLVPGS